MEKEQCETCFSDLQKKGNELFENMEKKHDQYISDRKEAEEYRDKQKSRKDNLMAIVFTILCAVIGYNYIETNILKSEVEKKANKNEVLRIDDARTIRELGDKYYDARYVIKDNAEPDPINYKQFVETLFERASRNGQNINN